MTGDVLLTTRGMQFDINESGIPESVEIVTAARLFEKGDHFYLTYDEIVEGVDDPVASMVRFSDSSIEVTKKGAINVHMVFDEGKTNLTNYQTPFGTIMIGIDTHKVTVIKEEKHIHLQADYGLDVNYEFLADCQVCMDIVPREAI